MVSGGITTKAAGSANPVITAENLPDGKVGAAYNYTVPVTSPTPITFWEWDDEMPPGLSFNTSTGVLSGTPTAAGEYILSLIAYNVAGHHTKVYTVTILPSGAETVTIGAKSGMTGTVTYAVTTSGIANGATGTVNWFSRSALDITSPVSGNPSGITSSSVSAVSDNSATVTINGNAILTPGTTLLFSVTIAGVTSDTVQF